MPCASEQIIMGEVSGHISEHVNVINVFPDINAMLYTLAKIHPKAEILLKASKFSVVQT